MALTAVSAKRILYEASVWFDKETHSYLSHAWPIDVMSVGRTEEHALKMLEEAVGLFVDTVREDGNLDLIAQEAGYRLEGDVLVPPKRNHFSGAAEFSTEV